MWAILALTAALLTSFNPILYKRMLADAGPVAVVWGVIALALPLLAITTFALTPALPNVDAPFLWASLRSAALNTLAHLASARSLKLADASLVTPLLTFSPVFTVLISAIFLGEIPDTRGLLGVMLVLIGAYGLNRGSGSDWLSPFKSISAKPGGGWSSLLVYSGLLHRFSRNLPFSIRFLKTLASRPWPLTDCW